MRVIVCGMYTQNFSSLVFLSSTLWLLWWEQPGREWPRPVPWGLSAWRGSPVLCRPGGDPLCSVSLEGIPCALPPGAHLHQQLWWLWSPQVTCSVWTPYSLPLILYKGTRTGRWVAVAILGTYLVTLGSSGAQFHHHWPFRVCRWGGLSPAPGLRSCWILTLIWVCGSHGCSPVSLCYWAQDGLASLGHSQQRTFMTAGHSSSGLAEFCISRCFCLTSR